MILIYLDESGTNYKNQSGLYVDGPFIIFGGMFVHEDVYWSLERLFCQLIDTYFGIDNWLESEVHATDIWHGNALSKHLDLEVRRNFFDEFLQLCGKFGLQYNFSFNLKSFNPSILDRNTDMLKAAHSLLMLVEHNLAAIHQTGILVCDATTGSERLRMKEIANMDMANVSLSSGQALLRQFHAMTAWRSIKAERCTFPIKPKYEMEAMSAYLIDRVHFLPSNDSLFLQMCDILTFVTQRCLVNDYLICAASERAKPEKVPVTKHGLSMMIKKLYASRYVEPQNDVNFNQFRLPDAGFLADFQLWQGLDEEIPRHYANLQPKQN